MAIAAPVAGQARSILGVRVDATSYDHACDSISTWARSADSRYVCVACVDSVVHAQDDPAFAEVMNAADLVTPDGMPLVWGLRKLGVADATRVYGPDLTLALCARAEREGIPVGFYGSTDDVLDDLIERLQGRFPRLAVPFRWSPPFGSIDRGRDLEASSAFNASGARILFVGLGCPKQERWMAAHRGTIAGVTVGVGAAFDFLAGRKRQAPAIMQRFGLEWMFRLITEPKRLWRRYLTGNPRFAASFARQLVRGRRSRHRSSPPTA